MEERKVAKLEDIDIDRLNGVKWYHLQKMEWKVLERLIKKCGSRSESGSTTESHSVSISSLKEVNIQSPPMTITEHVQKDKARKKAENREKAEKRKQPEKGKKAENPEADHKSKRKG